MNTQEDDDFCRALYEQYKADPDKGQTVSLEEAAALLEITLTSMI